MFYTSHTNWKAHTRYYTGIRTFVMEFNEAIACVKAAAYEERKSWEEEKNLQPVANLLIWLVSLSHLTSSRELIAKSRMAEQQHISEKSSS